MPLVHVNGIGTDIITPSFDNREHLNFMSMTDGEFLLKLKAEQYKLLQQTYPYHKEVKVWNKAQTMYENAIYKGIHGTTGSTSFIGFLVPELYEVQADIKKARARMVSASGGTIDLKGRKNIGIGTSPIIEIPPPNCDEFITYDERGIEDTNNQRWKDCYNNHYEGYKWERALNEYLEKSAHHLLYEFATDEQASQMRPTKAWKLGEHQKSISIMSDITKLSRENIVEWHRLGIMRQNATKGIGALPPLQSINAIFSDQNATFENVQKNYKDPSIGVIPFAVAVIWACVGAIVAIGGLIQILKGKEPTAFDRIAGIGKAMFSAVGGDNVPQLGGDTNTDENTDTTDETDTGTGNNNDNNTGDKKGNFFEDNKGLIIGGTAALVGGYLLLKD